jgi:hypothetical protein
MPSSAPAAHVVERQRRTARTGKADTQMDDRFTLTLIIRFYLPVRKPCHLPAKPAFASSQFDFF